VRGGEYSCSNDEGATWHRIEGIPASGYQPFITVLPDDRLFCVFHVGGGDAPFGESDLYIGAHIFRLEANLAQPTRLSLTREMDTGNTRYINSYTATLTSGGYGVGGKTIRYAYKKRYMDNWVESTAVTKEAGQARIHLGAVFEGVTNIHLSYELKAWFAPDPGDDSLAPCRSDIYFAYAITSTRKDLGWE
jgi:hypothetical protein